LAIPKAPGKAPIKNNSLYLPAWRSERSRDVTEQD